MNYRWFQFTSNIFAVSIGSAFLIAHYGANIFDNSVFLIALLAGAILPFFSVTFFVLNVLLRIRVQKWADGFVSNLLLNIFPMISILLLIARMASK